MHARWQSWIQALRKPFRDDQLLGDLLELHIRLKSLYPESLSVRPGVESMEKTTHLQELLQERDTVRPFVHIVERIQALFHLLHILLKLWIRRIGLLDYSFTTPLVRNPIHIPKQYT
jgi:hypothetical protein